MSSEKNQNWHGYGLKISIALTLFWWLSGFVWEPKPSWWHGVFMAFNIVAMGFVWMELRRQSKKIDTQNQDIQGQDFQGSQELAYQKPHQEGSSGAKTLHAAAVTVRNFASLDDARQYGWVFGDQIGTYDNSPLYRTAKKEGEENFFVFDGLARNKFPVVISDAFVAFGRMMYKKDVQKIAEVPSEINRPTDDFIIPTPPPSGNTSVAV